MKQTTPIAVALLSATLLCACSGKKKEVSNFAADFAQKVEAGKVDSLKMVYPAIADADSIAIKFVADSLKVDETDKDGVYSVSYGNGVTALMQRADDGRITVVETKGLFAYPKDKITFAQKTGALKPGINDAEKARIMADVESMAEAIYEKYSARRKGAIQNLGLTITRDIMFMMDTGSGYYTLKNTTDKPISGNEYTITWLDEYIGIVDSRGYRVEKGKDIPAYGTVRLPITFTGHAHTDIHKITMKELSADEFMAIYTPTGNEYETYLKENGSSSGKMNEKLSDGPYKIKGKLGGKYAIHMTLDKGMKTGSYYYDKNGAGNPLTLLIKSFNPRTGKIKIEEHNAKGEVTGTFTGTLSATSFSGKMTSFQGKTYAFDMASTME